jgi:hypothetical protein
MTMALRFQRLRRWPNAYTRPRTAAPRHWSCIYSDLPKALLRPRISQSEKRSFNAQIDSLVQQGVRVTTCIGLAQKFGAETAFRARGITLESAALAFPRFAAEAATVISF